MNPVDVVVPAELAPGETLAQRLARHPDRDVVVLPRRDALSELAIARLAGRARSESSIATASVFSNAGPLAYRAPLAAEAIDALFARENAGLAVEIPSAVPPCVYIARRALVESGAPDAWNHEALLRFSNAATALGFHHVLCADVYVEAGPAERAALPEEWRDFATRAPDLPLRRRVDLARIRGSNLPRILFITHRWGGGVELHVNDLARLLANDCEVIVLRPGVGGSVQIRWLREGEGFEAWFDAATGWEACREMLRALGIARIHIHHVHGLPRESLELPSDLALPYDVTLHDHFAICPQYHLATAQGAYCGEPARQGCEACLAARPAQWGLDITAWRDLFHRVLAQADRVIAPSADVGARIQRYFPDVQPQVWPHPEMRGVAPRVGKVLVLGGLSAIKGVDLFEACVRDAQERRLPLHFQVLGHISRPLAVDADAPVTVLGSYSDERLGALVALERPDAFVFLSQVPETFSYTLGVAMQAGKPIVATQLGAFTERLRGYPAAALVPHDGGAHAVNDALVRLLRAPLAAAPRTLAISAD